MSRNDSPKDHLPKSQSLHSQVRRARFSVSNLPIKHRLPLIIGTLLFGIILTSILASYRSVKDSALEVGRERLLSLTQQLASQSQQSLPLLLNRTFTAANDAAIRTYLQAPSSRTRPAALAVLEQFATAKDPGNVQVELWNPNHTLALAMPDGSSPEPVDLEMEFKQCATDPFKAVGSIRVVKDVIGYTAVAAVKNDEGKPIGFLVRWRRISPTPNARERLADLLGSEAALYFGNSKGDVWTDLEKSVPSRRRRPS